MAVAGSAHRGARDRGHWLAHPRVSGNSRTLVGAAARPGGDRELANRLASGMVTHRHISSSGFCPLPGHRAPAPSLLFPVHLDLTHPQRNLDCLARGSMVVAPRPQPRPRSRPRGHRIAHAPRRAHPQGINFCCRRARGTRQPGLRHEHRARWPRHRGPGHRLRRAEDHRKSFWRSFRSRG